MDVTELHDEENLQLQLEDRWEKLCDDNHLLYNSTFFLI